MSDLGGQLTAFALPTIAIISLGASPLAVGSLQAFEFAVVPLLATVAGVLADRHPRKPLMIGANVVRALALGSLPLAWWLHALTLTQFFVVGGICAAAGVLFDTAYQALLPALCVLATVIGPLLAALNCAGVSSDRVPSPGVWS